MFLVSTQRQRAEDNKTSDNNNHNVSVKNKSTETCLSEKPKYCIFYLYFLHAMEIPSSIECWIFFCKLKPIFRLYSLSCSMTGMSWLAM